MLMMLPDDVPGSGRQSADTHDVSSCGPMVTKNVPGWSRLILTKLANMIQDSKTRRHDAHDVGEWWTRCCKDWKLMLMFLLRGIMVGQATG